MIKFLKKIIHPFLKRLLFWYFSRSRIFRYKNLKVKIYPSIFPPHYTISTKLFLRYIQKIDFRDKTVLELGCGSGILSIFAAKQGANVTASDINQVALNALKENSKFNSVDINIVHSNLFEELNIEDFDVILINPPYYPKAPTNNAEYAWFCGENFEYFSELFNQIAASEIKNTSILMILSDNCDLKHIHRIARTNNIVLKQIYKARVINEQNFIFKINRK